MKDSHLFRPNVESKGTEHHGTRLENTLKGVMLVLQRALFVVMKHKVVARMKSVALTMRSGSYVIKVSELNLYIDTLKYTEMFGLSPCRYTCSNFNAAETINGVVEFCIK